MEKPAGPGPGRASHVFDDLFAELGTLHFDDVGFAFLFGVAVQKLLLDAAVGQPELTGLLITFGLGLVMIYTAELIFTTDFRTIPYAPGTIQLTRSVAVGQNRVISFAMAVVITAAVFFFLKFSRLGKAVRATALNAEVAMVCGIDVRRIFMITTGLAAADFARALVGDV